MTDATKIEWADSTFNPWTGCTKVSPACDHCYAESWSKRAGAKVGKWGPGAPRVRTSAANWRQPIKWNATAFEECADCGWRGETHPTHNFCPQCDGEQMKPARRRVFCASLADVFDNEVPVQWRRDLFDLIAATPNIDWLLLTKRIGNVRHLYGEAYLDSARALPANVWLGATICNQTEADRDIPKLLATPARVRFLSIEPMLGPVDVSFAMPWRTTQDGLLNRTLDWVICGGESGPNARPMHPDWVRSLRDQCADAGVPFLFKQWGEWCPAPIGTDLDDEPWCDIRFGEFHALSDQCDFIESCMCDAGETPLLFRIGKKAAGRKLDGIEHNGFPT